MGAFPGIDYDFQPASYWRDDDLLAALLRNVKGSERRRMIKAYWQAGKYEHLGDQLKTEQVQEDFRKFLGRLHPDFMGGEYLPDYRPGETEIARIELKSTSADVISIRARPLRTGIGYRIVDEYETKFLLPWKTGQRPMTLSRFIAFLDGARQPDLVPALPLCFNQMNLEIGENTREKLRDFTTVSSEIYPGLQEHYVNVFDDWVRQEPGYLGEE